ENLERGLFLWRGTLLAGDPAGSDDAGRAAYSPRQRPGSEDTGEGERRAVQRRGHQEYRRGDVHTLFYAPARQAERGRSRRRPHLPGEAGDPGEGDISSA